MWLILDDILLANGIFHVLNYITKQQQKVDWVTGGGRCYNTHSELIKELNTGKKNNERASKGNKRRFAGYTFLGYSWILHASTFLSKEVYETVGRFTNMHAMDTEYWLRMEINGFECNIIGEQVSGLRYHEDAKTVDRQYEVLSEIRENAARLEESIQYKAV